MAIERRLGTEENPDIIDQGSAVEIIPEQSRSDQIQEAAQISVSYTHLRAHETDS